MKKITIDERKRCPVCGIIENQVKLGFNRSGTQRCKCKECGKTYTLDQTSYGDSPYQSPSINAGNPYFVDLDILYEEGLLTRKELKEAIHKTKKVDYGWLFENRYLTLRKAFSRFTKNNEYKRFIKKNPWVIDYGLFISLKEKNRNVSWNKWPSNEKKYSSAIKQKNIYKDEIDFWSFIQFEFFKQWSSLKKYANDNQIEII